MRIAVLADIHGNMPALEAVLAEIEPVHPDGIIVAGDMVAGPKSSEVIHRLQDLGAWMIRGNNEEYLLRFDSGQAPAYWRTSRQWAFMRWVYQHMDKESMSILRSLPTQRVVTRPGKDAIRVVHGSPRDPNEHLYPGYEGYALDQALQEIDEPVLVCGHTHIPWQEMRDGCLAFNPGAVCTPLNGFVGAQYALLDWKGDAWALEFRQLKYDIDQAIRDFKETGLLENGGAYARALVHDLDAGNNQLLMKFVLSAFEQARKAGFGDCEYVPDEIWDHAAETFDWERNTL